jgi:hypothetical protein
VEPGSEDEGLVEEISQSNGIFRRTEKHIKLCIFWAWVGLKYNKVWLLVGACKLWIENIFMEAATAFLAVTHNKVFRIS